MKWPDVLRDEARDEAYEYFDKNIRALIKKENGKVDEAATGLQDNDVDAFRHAYVSGVFTMVYDEDVADILGRLNEYLTADLYSNSKDPRSLNMDLWNNAVGREYGKKAKDRSELLRAIHKALNKDELIIKLEDPRQYTGEKKEPVNATKPVIVLIEGENGRNELFFDLVRRKTLTLEGFVAQIEAGQYPAYTVKQIGGIPTPVSNPDGRKTNNLS